MYKRNNICALATNVWCEGGMVGGRPIQSMRHINSLDAILWQDEKQITYRSETSTNSFNFNEANNSINISIKYSCLLATAILQSAVLTPPFVGK